MDTKTETFPCPHCDRDDFKSPAARNMHVARVHTKTITPPNQRGRRAKMSHEEYLRRRRIYNRKWRVAHGIKATPWLHKDGNKQSGTKWTPARRKKFDATWKAKRNSGKKYMEKWYARKKEEVLEDPRGFINCCPKCGEELAAYYLAKGAMNRRKADRQ